MSLKVVDVEGKYINVLPESELLQLNKFYGGACR